MRMVRVAGACVALAIWSPTHARTANGATAAERTACRGLFGSSRGLCKAYCERLDCPFHNDDDPTTAARASAGACNRVLKRFLRQEGTPPPCVATSCPCWTAGQLVESFASLGHNVCFYDPVNAALHFGDPSVDTLAVVSFPPTVPTCVLLHDDAPVTVGSGISLRELNQCDTEIRSAASALQVTCPDLP